jgi:hypothetical protein
VTGEVDDKRAPDRRGDTFVCEQLHHIEKVAGMLPIECSDELAGVDIFRCKNGNLDLG